MIVTVIWNDFTCDGDDCHVQEVTLSDREGIAIHAEGIVRQGMRQYGHSEDLINEAIRRSYGLVGIIKGQVEWLA